jgi:GNAT superfamily N-acetyltransferase
MPTVWCPLTDSGLSLITPLKDIVRTYSPQIAPLVSVIGLTVEEGKIRFDQGDPILDLPGKHVLLLDASVHSGGTMLAAIRELQKNGAAGICTYSLVVKRGSMFIPTLWGVMIDDFDRAYFQLEEAPNNRLTTHSNVKQPYAHIRQLSADDVKRPKIESGVKSLDRAMWADRHYDMLESNDGKCTFLMEVLDQIVGYLTIHFDSRVLYIEEIAVDTKKRKNGYGGVLMRFADTLSRQSNCWGVRLNAIKERVDWYKGFGYQVILGRDSLHVEDEEYVPMEKRLVHHKPPMDDDHNVLINAHI